LGERAGNSVLEEFIGYLIYKENNFSYNSKVIPTLCKMVADVSRQPLSENKPLIGEKVYTHESGIHTSAILKNRASYQFINPSDFGQENTGFCFGKHSGKASIYHFFKEKNLQFDESVVQHILSIVKQKASNWKRPLTEIDLMNIYQQSICS
jgi:homocitrate synthase NifV